MTATRAIAIILFCTAFFAILGATIGYCLGRWAPGYFQAVFRNGREPWFQPIEVGTTLGGLQGLGAGLAVGIVVVLAVAWASSRRA